MCVVYRDKLGYVRAELTDGESGAAIDFCDGYAYFSVGEQDYIVYAENIVRVER